MKTKAEKEYRLNQLLNNGLNHELASVLERIENETISGSEINGAIIKSKRQNKELKSLIKELKR